jgi:hypothetical protein
VSIMKCTTDFNKQCTNTAWLRQLFRTENPVRFSGLPNTLRTRWTDPLQDTIHPQSRCHSPRELLLSSPTRRLSCRLVLRRKVLVTPSPASYDKWLELYRNPLDYTETLICFHRPPHSPRPHITGTRLLYVSSVAIENITKKPASRPRNTRAAHQPQRKPDLKL